MNKESESKLCKWLVLQYQDFQQEKANPIPTEKDVKNSLAPFWHYDKPSTTKFPLNVHIDQFVKVE